MLDSAYRKRLGIDLPRWRDAGWITAENAAAILASVDGRRSTLGLSVVVGTLGSLLLGLGVLAFVAANWEYMPRQVRFFLLIGTIGVSYAIAGVLRQRDIPAFAEAAILLAGLVFAAAIALIGQSYHLAGDFSDAVLLWTVGCLGAAILAASATATLLALVGSGYWTWLATVETGIVPHLPGLAMILAATALATWRDERFGRTWGVLAIGFWIALTVAAAAEGLRWSIAGSLALCVAAGLLLWSLGSVLATLRAEPRLAALGYDFLWPSLAASLASLAALQLTVFWRDTAVDRSWIALAAVCLVAAVALAVLARYRQGANSVDVPAVALIGAGALFVAIADPPDNVGGRLLGGGLVLGAALWAVSLGQSGIRPIGKKTGLVLFGLQIFYLYVVTLGTVLDTALAFLVGGVLFIALSIALVRIDRRLAARATTAQA